MEEQGTVRRRKDKHTTNQQIYDDVEGWNAQQALRGIAGRTFVAAFLFFPKHWVSYIFDRHAGVPVVLSHFHLLVLLSELT